MKNSYDIVVVGASSAGAYYARRMAEQGFSVLVIDKMSKETISPEYDIAHFDRRDMVKHGLPIPQEGDGIWSFAFDKAYHYSPTYTDPKPYDLETRRQRRFRHGPPGGGCLRPGRCGADGIAEEDWRGDVQADQPGRVLCAAAVHPVRGAQALDDEPQLAVL